MIRRVLLATFLATASLGALYSPAVASCVGPSIVSDPSTVAIGDATEVRGDGFFVGCNDVMLCTPDGKCEGGEPMPPDTGIEIELTQGSKSWTLARVDADDDFTFGVEVHIPAQAQPGPAVLTARGRNGQPQTPVTLTQAPVAEPEPSPAPPDPSAGSTDLPNQSIRGDDRQPSSDNRAETLITDSLDSPPPSATQAVAAADDADTQRVTNLLVIGGALVAAGGAAWLFWRRGSA